MAAAVVIGLNEEVALMTLLKKLSEAKSLFSNIERRVVVAEVVVVIAFVDVVVVEELVVVVVVGLVGLL